MNIQRAGSQTSSKGPTEWFTGSLRIDSYFKGTEPSRVTCANVSFEAGARTARHTHPSPIVAEVDGIRQYIQLTRGGVPGVAANDGAVLWTAQVAGNGVAVVATPSYRDHLASRDPGRAGCFVCASPSLLPRSFAGRSRASPQPRGRARPGGALRRWIGAVCE